MDGYLKQFKLANEEHYWEDKVFQKTWVAIFDNIPVCSKCKQQVTKGNLCFVMARRIPGKVSILTIPPIICGTCYDGEYPGRTVIVEYD